MAPARLVEPSASTRAIATARDWPAKALEPFYELFTCHVERSDVRVAISREYDRKPHPAADEAIETVWKAKVAAAEASGGRLFDKSKFRMHRIRWAGEDGDEAS